MFIQKGLCFLRLNISPKQKTIINLYKKLETRSFDSKEDIEKRQLEKFNKLLDYSRKNVPYYKKTLKNIPNIRHLSDLSKIPILTKDIIRKEKENLYSKNIFKEDYYKNSSGGSTGEPVVFLQNEKYKISNMANFLLIKSWRNCSPYDATITIWGAERDILAGKKPFKEKLLDFQLNRIRLNSFKMSAKDMKKYIDILNTKKPKLIIAYVQSIYELAKFAKANNIHVERQQAIHAAAGTVY